MSEAETRFTKEQRQQIVREFAEKNGGVFDAAAFLGEVNQVGKGHPAWGWFEWDNRKAAREHRLQQARAFAQGLRIRFEVETIDQGSVKVVSRSMPLVISPMHSRQKGGGYHLADPNDPAHLAELCRQAAQQLRWFVERFQAALDFAEVSAEEVSQIAGRLDTASSVSRPEAAE
jgi:hypothetical protein